MVFNNDSAENKSEPKEGTPKNEPSITYEVISSYDGAMRNPGKEIDSQELSRFRQKTTAPTPKEQPLPRKNTASAVQTNAQPSLVTPTPAPAKLETKPAPLPQEPAPAIPAQPAPISPETEEPMENTIQDSTLILKTPFSSTPNLESVISTHKEPVTKIPSAKPQPTTPLPQFTPNPVTNHTPTAPLPNNIMRQSSTSYPDFQGIATPVSSNRWLTVTAVIAFICTLGAGAYYYLFVYNKAATTFLDNISVPSLQSNNNPDLPGALNTAQVLNLKPEENVLIALKNQAAVIKGDSFNAADTYFQIQDAQNNVLSSIGVISGMGIKLEDMLSDLGNIWVFFHLQDPQLVKLGLVIEIKPDANIAEKLDYKESGLPSRLSSLFVDEQIVIPDSAKFSQSQLDPRVRYFNISPSASIDYAIVSSEKKSFLVIGTSRETLQAMLTQLGI